MTTMGTTRGVTGVRPVSEMVGEDDDETAEFAGMLEVARTFLRSHSWCYAIREEGWGGGVGGVVAVFHFRIEAAPGVDDALWVVCGDLPTAYLVTDDAPDPAAAVRAYCDVMDDWIAAFESAGSLDDVFPVAAAPTRDHAALLRWRTTFLRDQIVPWLGSG